MRNLLEKQIGTQFNGALLLVMGSDEEPSFYGMDPKWPVPWSCILIIANEYIVTNLLETKGTKFVKETIEYNNDICPNASNLALSCRCHECCVGGSRLGSRGCLSFLIFLSDAP